MILVRNNQADQRTALDCILHLVGGGNHGIQHPAFQPGPLQMLRDGRLRRVHGVGFGSDIRRRGILVGPPVIQYPGNMYNMGRLLRQPQDDVVILAAVIFLPESAPGLLQQALLKHRKMADVVVAPQGIRREVRLVMGPVGIRRSIMEGVLIRIDEVRVFPADHFHIFGQGEGMQQVIMVKQPDVIPGCHLQAGVRVFADAPVLLQLQVSDPRVFLRVFPADFPDVRVFRVAAVRQAQLPFFIGLADDRVNHGRQVFFRGVVKRHQDAEGDIPVKLHGLLGIQILRRYIVSAVPQFPGRRFLVVCLPPAGRFLPSVLQEAFEQAELQVNPLMPRREILQADHQLPGGRGNPPEERPLDRREVGRRLMVLRRELADLRLLIPDLPVQAVDLLPQTFPLFLPGVQQVLFVVDRQLLFLDVMLQRPDLRLRRPVIVDGIPRHPVHVVLGDSVMLLQHLPGFRIPENPLEQVKSVPFAVDHQHVGSQQQRFFTQDLAFRFRVPVPELPVEYPPEQFRLHLRHRVPDNPGILKEHPAVVLPALLGQGPAIVKPAVPHQGLLDHVNIVLQHNPQPKVVILHLQVQHAVIPDLLQRIHPDHGAGMAKVVAGGQQLMDPLGPAPVRSGEYRPENRILLFVSVFVDKGHQRKARAGIRILLQVRNLLFQLVRLPQVVLVQHSHILSPGLAVPDDMRVAQLAVFLQRDQPDPGIVKGGYNICRSVRGCVIDHDHFPVRIRLGQRALNRLPDKLFPVVQRQDDTDQRLLHLPCSFCSAVYIFVIPA